MIDVGYGLKSKWTCWDMIVLFIDRKEIYEKRKNLQDQQEKNP